MNTIKRHYSQSGISMIFVLAALLVTGFIGVAMIKMVTGDQLGNVFYASSATARSAAQSGIIAAIQKIEGATPDKNIVPILQAWINAAKTGVTVSPVNKWLAGASTGAPSDFIAISGASNLWYRTKIVAFDPTNFNITLMSEGKGNGGAQAVETAVYHIDGLEYRTTGDAPTNALQMDNGNFEFNCKLTVEGGTQVMDRMGMNTGPVKFDGTLRIDPLRGTNTVGTTTFDVETEITKEAYFAGDIITNKQMTFRKSAGFEKMFSFGVGNFSFHGDGLYLNGGATINGGTQTSLNNHKLYPFVDASTKYIISSKSKTPDDLFTDKTGSNLPAKTTNLSSLLGLGALPPQVFFNKSLVLAHTKKVIVPKQKTIDEDWLTDEYGKTGNLWNGFLVVHFASDYKTNGNNKLIQKSSNGNQFNGKAIIIIDATEWETMSFETTNSANVAIYVENYMGSSNTFNDISNFRGFIYANSAKKYVLFNNTTNPSKECFYQGAIYATSDATTKFDGGASVHHRIKFEESVIKELVPLGIFTNPNDPNASKLSVDKNHANLITDLISQSM